jgi:hypothetical protein
VADRKDAAVAATAHRAAAPTRAASAIREKQQARAGRCDFCRQRGVTQTMALAGNQLVACDDCTTYIVRRDLSRLVQRALEGCHLSEATHPGCSRRFTEDYGALLASMPKTVAV